MKPITIQGEELFYQTSSDSWHGDITIIYKKYFKKAYKYLFFGSLITIVRYKRLFEIKADIEDISYTRQSVSNWTKEAYEKYKAREQRKEEIERGEII